MEELCVPFYQEVNNAFDRSGGGGGGTRDAHPPVCPFFFQFDAGLSKNWPKIALRPQLLGLAVPHLDPQLLCV